MSNSIYRPRGSNNVRQTVNLSKETIAGLDKIRQAFYTRFPKDAEPTISAIFETVLAKASVELDADPEWLEVEVRDFQRRYLQRKNAGK